MEPEESFHDPGVPGVGPRPFATVLLGKAGRNAEGKEARKETDDAEDHGVHRPRGPNAP